MGMYCCVGDRMYRWLVWLDSLYRLVVGRISTIQSITRSKYHSLTSAGSLRLNKALDGTGRASKKTAPYIFPTHLDS
jgi:hypothetical protein